MLSTQDSSGETVEGQKLIFLKLNLPLSTFSEHEFTLLIFFSFIVGFYIFIKYVYSSYISYLHLSRAIM